MSTIINSDTIARLNWIAGELAKLYNNGWLRYEGDPVFKGAQQELADIIATATEPARAAPTIVQEVMTAEQVAGVVSSITEEIERSDTAVMSAIVQAGADTVAAIKPAAEPAA